MVAQTVAWLSARERCSTGDPGLAGRPIDSLCIYSYHNLSIICFPETSRGGTIEKVKVGMLVPMQGPMGVWAPSCMKAATLGAAEINAAGGVAGKELELIIRDAKWKPEAASSAARQLVAEDEVSAIVAMVGSHARGPVAAETDGNCPFVYTPNYEQGSVEANTIGISATDDQMLGPTLEWIFEKLGARRFFMVGCDYRWPLLTMPMAGKMIRARGGSVAGMLPRPINATAAWDFEAIDKIGKTRPDVLLCFLVGDQAIDFHRHFHQAGLQSTIPRVAIATDESILASLDPDGNEGLFAGAYYFMTARTNANVGFMERYWTEFGELAPVPGAFGQSCYEGIQFAAGLINSEKSVDRDTLLHAPLRKVAFNSARFDTPTANLTQRLPVYIAKANGPSFDVVARY